MTRRRPWLWRDWPLAVKLAVLLVGIAILPLVMVTLSAEITTRRDVVAESRERILQRAHTTAALLDRYFADVINDVTVIAMAPVAVDALQAPVDTARLQTLRTTLEVAQRTKRLEVISVLNDEGIVIASSDKAQEGRNRLATPFFLWANAGQARVHEPRYVAADGRVEINVSVPIRAAARTIGVAVSRISFAEIDRLVASDTGSGGLAEYGVLWDERGIVLSSPARSERRFRPMGRLQPSTRDQLIAEQRYGPETSTLLDAGVGGDLAVERSRWRLYDERGLDAFEETQLSGVTVELASVPLGGQRWTYAVAVPLDAILAAVHAEGRRNLLVATAAAILALTLSVLAAGWVSRPLGRVRSAATALADGDMAVRAGLSQHDEIGEMADAFDRMADALSAKDAELRRHAETLERRVGARTAALQRSEERTRFLMRAAAAIASSLDQDSIADALARLALPTMGTFCMVDVVDRGGAVRLAAVAATDAGLEERLRRMRAEFPMTPDAPSTAIDAIRSGRPRVFNPDEVGAVRNELARSDRHRQVLDSFGPLSGVVVPLLARGETLGAMTFGQFGDSRRYDEADLELAQELAYRAAVALENSRLYRELQESSRLKDEFLGVVSHELRTPLNALLGWVHVLRRGGLEPIQARRALESVERNARAQAQLVEDLLDTSRVISGKLRIALHPTDIAAVVDQAVESFRPLAASRRIAFVTDVQAAPSFIEADAARLQQVVGNLLSNALKFTLAGGTVSVGLAEKGSDIEIRVTDTGVGIAAEFLPYVFERFRQADSTTTRAHGGLGIGLAIARHLVELHGGTIRAESEGENRGSSFIVRIPARVATTAAVLDDRLLSARPALAGTRVLIVDDERDARELLRDAFEEAGAQVTIAAGADEAITAFRSDPLDLLVSDIGLPGRDGYSLIQELRQQEQQQSLPPIAALAVSAYARDEDYVRSLRAGYDRHLAKPIIPTSVVAAAHAVLAAKGPHERA